MVEFKEAYEIATNFFLENDYAGVDEAKDTNDMWLFAPKCNKTCYGAANRHKPLSHFIFIRI